MARSTEDQLCRAGRIRDARGRSVKQLDPIAMLLLARHDVIEKSVLQAIADEPGIKIVGRERLSLMIGCFGLLIVAGLFTISLAIKKDFGSAPIARTASLFFFCVPPWLAWIVSKRARFGKVAAAMLKFRRCPHCGYDLRLLLADPADGATVCPECGCAWLLRAEPHEAPRRAAVH